MHLIRFFLVALFLLNANTALGEMDLKISSLNLRWFGLGGEMSGRSSDEFREPWIREFLKEELPKSDVILFQEIVDVDRFIDEVIGKSMNCVSYSHPYELHQHLVICHLKKYRFVKEKGDDNYTFEDLVVNPRNRPAVYGRLFYGKKPIARIINLHLKAYPHRAGNRIDQVKALAKGLAKMEKLPTIIGGDFNSYPKNLTEREKNDVDLYRDIFRNSKLNLRLIKNPYKYTYRVPSQGHKLDHFWISKSIKQTRSLWMGRACHSGRSKGDEFIFSDVNDENIARERYDSLSFYNRFISDHCPITVSLKVK